MMTRLVLLVSAVLLACGSSTPAPERADGPPPAASAPPACRSLADRTCGLCGEEAGLCHRYRQETDEARCQQLHVRVGEAETQIRDQRVEPESREAYQEAFCR